MSILLRELPGKNSKGLTAKFRFTSLRWRYMALLNVEAVYCSSVKQNVDVYSPCFESNELVCF